MKMGMKTEVPGLFQTPDGWTLRAKSRVGSVTTEKARKLVGATKAEAMVALERLRDEARADAEAKSRGEDIRTTLSVFARRYVEELGMRMRSGQLRRSTAERHTMNMARFILPFLGDKDVGTLTPKDVKAWLRSIEQLKTLGDRKGRGTKRYGLTPRPFAKATLANAWRTLRAFMGWLTVEADLPRNPAAYVRWQDAGGLAAPVPKTVLTRDEVTRLLEVARADADRAAWPMFAVALAGALRSSELTALQRGDIDLEHGTILIQRSHVAGDIGKPKTRGSRRVIVLPPDVVEALRALMARQDEQETKGRPLLFPTTHGTPRTPSSVNHVLGRCAEGAGIAKEVTSHALRRTANNLVRQTSGDLVARMITGHTTVAMTEHYSLVDADERAEALRKAFGAALGGTGPTAATADAKTPRG
ncbi:MAG: site-specific integrase [Deltaproteobacteria bacterium]|nr:site-specific integrase [Deltaproteobacteria bacterium]